MIVIEQKPVCKINFENDIYNNTVSFSRVQWVNVKQYSLYFFSVLG